ncbi:MAG: hypothetical protein KGL39_12065 [Patescibacteria group bacterium]|nr:hypothetical protein [Patescibacteria group bacterium]
MKRAIMRLAGLALVVISVFDALILPLAGVQTPIPGGLDNAALYIGIALELAGL